ncbi:MAG: acyltransferase [Clostridia bacterium]|nr:acyltransferase [Clostridia bacterium]
MIYFITVLRALAACLITNSHYKGIYPLDIIANGGLLGDVIFFAVSGFCLANVTEKFLPWFKKRVIRIYIPVAIVTVIFLAIAQFYEPISVYYNFDVDNVFLHYFIYPTEFHFVGSIILLYIPYYFVAKYIKKPKGLFTLASVLTVVCVLVYVFIYDKSYYHIDVVREPFIRFLFFYAMLLGLLFRRLKDRLINKFRYVNLFASVVLFGAYFVTKFYFSRNETVAELQSLQILNQLILLLLLYFVFALFISMDSRLEALPKPIKRVIEFIAKITLEIYLVQTPIIIFVRSLGLFFPLNWIVVTALIIISALALHKVSGYVIFLEKLCFEKAKEILISKTHKE